MLKKYKCIYCNKIVWIWQKQYLGLDTAHSKCDNIAFVEEIDRLVFGGYMTQETANKNIRNRQSTYY